MGGGIVPVVVNLMVDILPSLYYYTKSNVTLQLGNISLIVVVTITYCVSRSWRSLVAKYDIVPQ